MYNDVHILVQLGSFCHYIARYEALFIIIKNGALGADKQFLRMHKPLHSVRMDTAQPVMYGYLSDVACSTTRVLMFHVYTMPKEMKTYRAFAPILFQLTFRNIQKSFKKMDTLQINSCVMGLVFFNVVCRICMAL